MKKRLNEILDDVANATVMITNKGGQGVLIHGNLILTAAHCLDFNCDGSMVLGDDFIHTIKTTHGELKVSPLAVEPVSDIAVLGSLDNQRFSREAQDFERFCEQTKPVGICADDLKASEEFTVYIRSHRGRWLNGRAQICAEGAASIFIDSDRIEGGTSGGPIINECGDLVGIVSNFAEFPGETASTGPAPRPHLTLPVWVWERILASQTEGVTGP